jgi:hypothetical protein
LKDVDLARLRPNSMKRSDRKIIHTAVFALGWIAALTAGLGALTRYENRPGAVGNAPDAWPQTSRIARSNDRYTLVMLAHPFCPCTRASVNELAQVMAQVHGKVNAYVLFLKPRDSSADWDAGSLRHEASKIPDVTVLSDVDGAEAERFGGETSGFTVLFDRDGKRVFAGGITASRGHEGDNAGESAVVSFVNDRPSLRSTSVFGCSLHSHSKPESTPCPN